MSKSVSILAVGDLAPTRSLSGSNPAVKQVWSLFQSADLVMANLELPLTHSKEKADKVIVLRADPVIAGSLQECGINVVTVANNHAMDYGSTGLMETITALENKGIKAVGGGENLKAAMRFEIFSVGGLKVAVLGMASTLPTGYAAGADRPGVAPVRARSRFYIDSVTLDEQPGISPWVETTVEAEDMARACKQVALAKQQADIVIVQMHWGIPNGWCAAFQGPLADYQKTLGHALIDAGADVIVGSHPHIIHGAEKYHNGVIVYSAGNFLFHSMGAEAQTDLQVITYPPYNVQSLLEGEARDGLIVEICTLDKRLAEVRFLPVSMNLEGDPEFSHGEGAARTLNRLRRLSEDLGTVVRIDGETATLSLS